MTSRTSLFNKGIYKSTVRRYVWGAVLYAIILLMSTAIPILFTVDPETHWMTRSEYNYQLILSEGYLYFPLVVAVAVPTVVALLVYRFVHSKKSAIFTHSLPVTRTANYISTLAAALTLMAVPIIFSGAVLALISACGYGELFDVSSCLIWTGINLLSVFLMFSCSSFCAFLTGNSFALVALNILIHLIAIIIAGSFSTLADVFLYGYYESNALLTPVTDWNFTFYIFSLANRLGSRGEAPFDLVQLGIMLVLASVLYSLALLLYKKRRIETAEDVAAYKILNPIFKYLLTFLAAIGTLGLCSYELEDGAFYPVLIVLLISAVVYFATEMVLRKSLKIWKSYKGYLAFLACFGLLVFIFAGTSCFGFETRVPKEEEVSRAAVYYNYTFEDEPYVEGEEMTRFAVELQREMVSDENIYTLRDRDPERSTYIYISYELRNGKTLKRRYPVTEKRFCEAMDELYLSQEYKLENLALFSDKIGEIYEINISHVDEEIKGSDITGLVEALQKDMLALDYTELREHGSWETDLWINYVRADELDSPDTEGRGMRQFHQSINAGFTNTIGWLRGHGYLDEVFNRGNYDLTVLTAEQWNSLNGSPETNKVEYAAGIGNSYGEVTVEAYKARTFEDIPGAVRISDSAAKERIREYVVSTPVRYVPDKEYSYYICTIEPNENIVNTVAAFYDDAVTEQLMR